MNENDLATSSGRAVFMVMNLIEWRIAFFSCFDGCNGYVTEWNDVSDAVLSKLVVLLVNCRNLC